MTDRSRYYLTTSIAYANNKPGVHTLYEVIGADAIARWHRMLGDDTRFLTGTDEHSINIAQAAVDEGRPTREFVDEKVALFHSAEAALGISADRFIRTTDPDHVRAAQEMVRRAYANGDIYLGTYEGWYCPNEGFRNATDVQETARGTICPNHPEVPLQWLTEQNWFFRLSAYQERLERYYADHPDFVQPDYRRNEMLGLHPRRPRRLLDQPRADAGRLGDPVPDRRERRDGAARGRHVGPGGRQDLRLVRRPDQLHHGRRLPRRPRGVRPLVAGRPARHRQGHRPLPHDLLAGDAVERRTGGAAPRLGPRLAARRRRRADEQEPRQLPRPERLRGRLRLRTAPATSPLREVPFDRDAEVQLGFVRPPLQRRPGQRLREPRQPDRLDDQPVPRRRAACAARAGPIRRSPRPGRRRSRRIASGSRRASSTTRLPSCGSSSAQRNKVVDAEQPWVLAKAWKAGDERAGERLRGVLGDLVEACRLVGPRRRAVPARDRAARPGQLGHRVPVRAGRQRRPADPRRARLGRPCRRAGTGGRAGAALPAARRRNGGQGG